MYLTVDPIHATTEAMGAGNIHCKPGPFAKQFCLANTAIFAPYITFQRNHK
jgi:hypothetical protein